MLKKKKNHINPLLLLLLLIVIVSSCSPLKKIPQNQYLYVGTTLKIEDENKQNIGDLNAEIEEIIRPIPNTLLLGTPYKVGFYYLLGEPKSEKGLKSWFRNRFGEKPVIVNEQIIGKNLTNITDLLENKGYFGSKVSGEIITKKKKASAIYKVQLAKQWKIDSVSFVQNEDSKIKQAIETVQARSLLKSGNPYDFNTIIAERIRIDRALKNKGFYYFRPDFLTVEADTLTEKYKVNLKVFINNKITAEAQNNYRIDEIVVFPKYFISGESNIQNTTQTSPNQPFTVIDTTNKFKVGILAKAIGFRKNNIYRADIHDISLQRLISLSNFKLVRNEFQKTSDSTLKAYYFLTPLKTNALKFEANGVTKSNSLTGTQLNINYKNRNLLRGAEIFSLNFSGGFEVQVGGKKLENTYDTYRLAVDGALSMPKLYLPFVQSRINNQTLPKTNLNFGYEVLKKQRLYDLTSLRASLGFSFRQNRGIEHLLTPLSINFVKAKNVSELFVEEIFKNPLLLKILENQLIVGGNYTFTYAPSQIGKKQYYFNGGIDVAGNLASLLTKKDEDGNKTLFGEFFAQYVRLDTDFRYFYDLNKKLRWANRVMTGFGIPYGTSLQLPYFKQFFAGGNNSIRAFRARAIGPGGYERSGSVIEQFLGNQSADVKLELNTELRYSLSNFLKTALFVDAGNIWMYKDEYIYGETALFTKDFYKQLAVGGGLGLRLDFGFFLMRFDVATPLRKPWITDKNGWVLDDIAVFNKDWRKENLLLNIAIGYPF